MGCDVHAVNKEGYTALHLGSMYEKEQLVSLLLSHQADPLTPKNRRFSISCLIFPASDYGDSL